MQNGGIWYAGLHQQWICRNNMNNNLFKIEAKNYQWIFSINGNPKYSLDFFQEKNPFHLKNIEKNEIIANGLDSVSDDNMRLFYNVFVAIEMIFELEGLDDNVLSYYALEDKLLLSLKYNEVIELPSLLIHDEFENGLFIENNDVYHSTWEGAEETKMDVEDIDYILTYANNSLSVYHYVLWKTFKPLLTYLTELECDVEEDIFAKWSLQKWLDVQKTIIDLGNVIPEMNLLEFLDFVEIQRENGVMHAIETDLIL